MPTPKPKPKPKPKPARTTSARPQRGGGRTNVSTGGLSEPRPNSTVRAYATLSHSNRQHQISTTRELLDAMNTATRVSSSIRAFNEWAAAHSQERDYWKDPEFVEAVRLLGQSFIKAELRKDENRFNDEARKALNQRIV